MRKFFVLLLVAIVLSCVVPVASAGPDAKSVVSDPGGLIVVMQNPNSTAQQKTAYVLALDGAVEVEALIWSVDAWAVKYPNPANDLSDDTIGCPAGYTLPVEGQFHALRITGSAVSCEIHWY